MSLILKSPRTILDREAPLLNHWMDLDLEQEPYSAGHRFYKLSMDAIAGKLVTWLSLIVEDDLADLLHHDPRGFCPFQETLQQNPQQVSEGKTDLINSYILLVQEHTV